MYESNDSLVECRQIKWATCHLLYFVAIAVALIKLLPLSIHHSVGSFFLFLICKIFSEILIEYIVCVLSKNSVAGVA